MYMKDKKERVDETIIKLEEKKLNSDILKEILHESKEKNKTEKQLLYEHITEKLKHIDYLKNKYPQHINMLNGVKKIYEEE